MSENDNLLRLKEISSSVNERDLKIYENVAHSICIKKAGEKLQCEIERMKMEINNNKTETELMRSLMGKMGSTINTQKETLRMSEQSLIMHQDLKNSLTQEMNDLRQKYSKTLEMYEDEYEEYKALYESSSKTYQELKEQKIHLKKLQVESMILDMKIMNLENSHKQYRKIQEQIFQNTIIQFAQFYTVYHKNEFLKQEIQKRKFEEQQLLKEHLQLQEKLKEKKKLSESTVKQKLISDNLTEPQEDKFKKFLDEELKPCSLTTIDYSQRVPNFNQEQTKVKILEVRTLKPPLKPASGSSVKVNELRKKMETIMQNAKSEAKRSNSFHVSPLASQNSQKATQEVESKSEATQLRQSSQEIKNSASILKKNLDICNSQETTSKFFDKKKSVTFENQTQKKAKDENDKFQLFSMEEQRSESVIMKNLDIFEHPFCVKSDQKKKTVVESDTDGSQAPSNVTFTGETEPSTFGTLIESADKQNEMTFDLLNSSFSRGFMNPPESSNSPTTFNFFGSQSKPTNPFNFF